MLRISRLTHGTLVKIGRGPNNVTESASNALLESLQDHGYCYIQHPFIQKSILDQLHRDCRVFFEQYVLLTDAATQGHLKRNNRHHYHCTPLTPYELESIKSPSGFRGYYRYVGASGLDDAIECFSVGRDDVPDPSVLRRDYYKQAGWEEREYLSMVSRRNPWDILLNHVNTPSTAGGAAGAGAITDRNDNFMSDFKDMIMAYYDLCHTVSMDLMRHISCGLGIRPSIPQGGPDPAMDYELEYFTAFHQKRDCDLQAKYYPSLGNGVRVRNGVDIENPRSAANPDGVKVLRRKGAKTQPFVKGGAAEGDADGKDVTVRLDTHKDLSTITLLSQDALGGLEVWDEEKGDYNVVPVLEDALLVNAGLFLEKWTGGLIEATPHRVRNAKGGGSRCSIVFFALPDHDARIEPLLQQEDNPAVDEQESFLAGDMMPSP